jgi:DNA-binding SARP family transcriptional activator/basic membrane lipoprotein Med (substrate-binding protein (PBP1-ABC) superfamily)
MVIDERHFPGRQGRLLFAYLVAEHGQPVPRDKLADVLWGDAPPATWDKALSVLVSKLRVVLAESGVDGASALTAAFGCYQLDLPEGAWVDVLAAESAAKEAEGFLDTDELESAMAAAALAESVTRSPFLPGDDGPWVEEKRRELAEVRARALSALAEASLRTDKPAEAVRWARLAVEAEPFRESGYRRLMEAHVAAGNRAEALRVYERCRRLLAEELGAYPSPETEAIYRSLLETPPGRAVAETPDATSPPETALPPARRRKRPVLAAAVLVVLVAAGSAIVLVATRGNGVRAPTALAATGPVTLVLPSSPLWSDDPSTAQYLDAVNNARTEDGIQTQVVHINLEKKGLAGLSRRGLKRIAASGLVLLAGQFVSSQFVHAFVQYPRTRFVVLDPDPIRGRLFHAVSSHQNTTDVFFKEGPGAYLAGFFSALMAKKQSAGKVPVVVSEILVNRGVSSNVASVFAWGAQVAVHHVRVIKAFVGEFPPRSRCEAAADKQIEQGSLVVFADAGACSSNALSAAKALDVWGVEGDQDAGNPPSGPNIVGYSVKDIRQAVGYAIRHYAGGALPRRKHNEIGIKTGAVDFVTTGLVPKGIRVEVEQEKQRKMPTWDRLGVS